MRRCKLITVIPAKAGTHFLERTALMGPRLRGDDGEGRSA
jgi:hypothetical protein